MVEALPLYRWKAGKEVALLPSFFVQVSGWQGIRGPVNLLCCISTGALVTEWKQEKLIWSCWEAELPIPVVPVVTTAERGLSGTFRELLQCLERFWWDLCLPHLPLRSPCPFSCGSPLLSALCQGAPLKQEVLLHLPVKVSFTGCGSSDI